MPGLCSPAVPLPASLAERCPVSIELSQKSKYVREVLVDLVLSTRALALARRLGLRGARGGAALAIPAKFGI